MAVALLLLHQWDAGSFSSRVAIPGLVITAAVWGVGELVFGTATSVFAFAIVSCLAALEMPRLRAVVLTGVAVVAVAVIGLKPVFPDPGGQTFGDMVLFVAFGGVAMTTLIQQARALIGKLDRARNRESELAIMREQVRRSDGLHDIQDRTLHEVEDKVALAKQLLHRDPARAERELDGAHNALRATSIETERLAQARRRINLSAELEKTKNLLEAADIRVHIDRADDVDTGAGELLGQVLREITTNILHHTGAGQVWITLTRDGLSVTNDGARGEGLPALSGLSALRERLADHGGELEVEQNGSRFRTVATVPVHDSGAVPTARKSHR